MDRNASTHLQARLVLVSCIIVNGNMFGFLFMLVGTGMSDSRMLVKLNLDAFGDVHGFALFLTMRYSRSAYIRVTIL